MYLTLSDFDHLRDDQTVRFREETVNGVEVVIISYMISNDDLWQKPLGLECRGITFEKESGKLISLPFEKFFNVNEKAWTQESVINDYVIQAALDKRDGSMITGAIVNGRVVLKTKKSFFSDVACAANRTAPSAILYFIHAMLEEGLCPIFEYTAPDSKIVINYGNDAEFVLLAIRNMSDGSYLDYSEMKLFSQGFGVNIVGRSEHTSPVGYFLKEAQTVEGVEGWVVYCKEGRFKIKTAWYMDRHRLIDVRERDIAQFVLEEKLDDMIPSLIEGQADMVTIRNIEAQVARELAHIMASVERLSGVASEIPLGAERAAWVNTNAGELAKFVHRGARGLENSDDSFKDFYRQRYLSNFNLRSIGNPNFRGDEE